MIFDEPWDQEAWEHVQQQLSKLTGLPVITGTPKSRQGWRTFTCYECQHTWEEPTRDAYSPSGETCPKCREGYVQPNAYRLDPTLPVDEFGNLKEVK